MYSNGMDEITLEDRCALKGILLDRAQYEISQHKSIKNILLIVSLIGVLVGLNLMEECILGISDGQFTQIFSWIIMYIIIIASVSVGIFNFYYELKHKPAQCFLCAVQSDDFEIERVSVISADNSSGENWSTEYYAEIMDENSVLFENRFLFIFKEEFKIGNAFYIKVKLRNGIKEIVIPGVKESPMTWEYGLKMYKKYIQ